MEAQKGRLTQGKEDAGGFGTSCQVSLPRGDAIKNLSRMSDYGHLSTEVQHEDVCTLQGRSLQCSLEETNVEAALQLSLGCNPSAQLLLFTEEISNKSRQHEVRPQSPLTLETPYLPSETHKHAHTRKRTHAYIHAHQKYSLYLNVTKFTSERDPAESQGLISEPQLPKGPKDFQEPCNLNTRYNTQTGV